MSMQPGTPFAWNFQRAGGQSAYEAAQNALNQKRAADYVSNMEDRQVGNGQDMMNWMQSGNDAAQYQADQAAAAQGQEAQKAEQIKAIESQIAEIQARIAQNQAKLKNFTGSANQIAALEAQKINSQDPTMIWRWQKQREDTARANDKLNATDSVKFKNKAALLMSKDPDTSSVGALSNQIANLETAILEGQNIGEDVSALLDKRKELLKARDSKDQSDYETGDVLDDKTATKKDIEERLKDPNLTNDQKRKLNMKWRELDRIKKNKAFASERDAFIKKKGYNPKTISKRMLETMTRQFKASKGMK